MREEINSWWEQAKRDVVTAENSFTSKDYYASVFWCHQAVEKGLKALLIKKTGKFPKIHDLFTLAKRLDAPEDIRILCSIINPAYTDARYPDFLKTYMKKDAEDLIKKSGMVLAWIEKNL